MWAPTHSAAAGLTYFPGSLTTCFAAGQAPASVWLFITLAMQALLHAAQAVCKMCTSKDAILFLQHAMIVKKKTLCVINCVLAPGWCVLVYVSSAAAAAAADTDA